MASEPINNGRQSVTAKTKHQSGRKSLLRVVMEENPDGYQRLLQYLRMGCYVHVAAWAIGVRRQTIYGWLQRGRQDHEKNRKTIYLRFFNDVMQALSQARLTKEIKLSQMANDGSEGLLLHWLKCGPGKMLGNEWQDQLNVNVQDEIGHDHQPNDSSASRCTVTDGMTALERMGVLEGTDKSGELFRSLEDQSADADR